MPEPEIVRPHWRFPFGGTVYEWHGHVGGVDALLIKDKAGLTPVALYAGVLTGEPYAIVALVFLAKRQAGERVTWDEVVAQFEGDDDLFAFPQKVINLETNPDPADPPAAKPNPTVDCLACNDPAAAVYPAPLGGELVIGVCERHRGYARVTPLVVDAVEPTADIPAEIPVRVEIFERTDPRLGRHVVHDERSRGFALESVSLVSTPVMHERVVPIFDQGQIGSCTANAQLGMLASGPFAVQLQRHGVYPAHWTEADALQLYREETRLDDWRIPGHYEPDDTGSAGIYACKATKRRGWITGYHHAFSLDVALGWLGRKPISIGIPWYSSMFTPDGEGLLQVDSASGVAGGHQVCLDGIDPQRRLVRVANSWGTGWGLDGRAWLRFDDLGRLLREGGDAVTVTV